MEFRRWVTGILPTVAQAAWLPRPHNGGLLLLHCIFNDPAPESHAFLFGGLQGGPPSGENVHSDHEYFIPRSDHQLERRERLVRALIEGEESGLSARSVRDLIASANSILAADQDLTGS
jgi:hypothetical protein